MPVVLLSSWGSWVPGRFTTTNVSVRVSSRDQTVFLNPLKIQGE